MVLGYPFDLFWSLTAPDARERVALRREIFALTGLEGRAALRVTRAQLGSISSSYIYV